MNAHDSNKNRFAIIWSDAEGSRPVELGRYPNIRRLLEGWFALPARRSLAWQQACRMVTLGDDGSYGAPLVERQVIQAWCTRNRNPSGSLNSVA